VRREDRLEKGLADLAAVEGGFGDADVAGETTGQRFDCLRRTYETRNLIEVARMLGTAALERQETRGGHFRLDFPDRNDERFLGNFIVRQQDGRCLAEFRPVPDRNDVAPPPPGEHTPSTGVSLD
jgi:succinate dehydrogenase/fumarate reductase flavoprotein subunit